MPQKPVIVHVDRLDYGQPLELSSYGFGLGDSELLSEMSATVTPVGGTPERVTPHRNDWTSLREKAWALKTEGPAGNRLTPLEELPAADLLAKITPDQVSYLESHREDPSSRSLLALIADRKREVGSARPDPPPVHGGPAWLAAPAPHWAWALAESQADAGAGPPEMSLGEDYLRIGQVSFVQAVGPVSLDVSSQSQVDISPVLRHTTALKAVGGALRQQITFSLMFPNDESIRKELVPFMLQSRRAPFLPIVHSGLLHTHGVTEVAVLSVELSTVPNHPEALSATVTCFPFPGERYLLDGDVLDACINYPLLELWIRSTGVQDPVTDPRDGSVYRPPVSTLGNAVVTSQDPVTPVWNGLLTLSTPSRDWLDLVNENETASERDLKRRYLSSVSPEGQSYAHLGATALQDFGGATAGDRGSAEDAFNSLPDEKSAEAAAGAPVVAVRNDPNGGGRYVAYEVTPELAPYAFAPAAKGGADRVYKALTFTQGVGLSAQVVSDSQLAELRQSGHTQALDGRYWALWRVGGSHALPAPDSTLASTLSDFAQQITLDPDVPQFTPPVTFTGFTIETVTAGFANTLAEITPSDSKRPEYQHLGSSDSAIEFVGVADVSTVQELYSSLHEVMRLAADYRGTWDGSPRGGYVRLDNEIAAMCGVRYAIPTWLRVTTMEDQPELMRVTAGFVQYDPGQRRIDSPGEFSDRLSVKGAKVQSTQDSTADFLSRIKAYGQIDERISSIDLYPDIQPPRWPVLDKWVRDVQNGDVWDEAADAPKPGYEFLSDWRYTPDWLAKWAPGFAQQAGPPLPRGADTPGYADPDFYCCGRGFSGGATGGEFFENLLSDMKSGGHTAVVTGSDGMTFGAQFGQNGVQLSPDAATAASVGPYVACATDGRDTALRDLLVKPPDAAKRAAPVPSSSSGDSSVGVGPFTLPAEPSSNAVVGGLADDEATYRSVVVHGRGWGKDPRYVEDLLRSCRQMKLPCVLMGNLVMSESGSGISRSSTGAVGLMQVQHAPGNDSYKEYMPVAIQRGYLPKGSVVDESDIHQNIIVGLMEYRARFEAAYNYLTNNFQYTDAQKQYYAHLAAVCGYNSGGRWLRLWRADPPTFLTKLHAATDGLKAQNQVGNYVSMIFGQKPPNYEKGAVTSPPLTLDSFKAAGAPQVADRPQASGDPGYLGTGNNGRGFIRQAVDDTFGTGDHQGDIGRYFDTSVAVPAASAARDTKEAALGAAIGLIPGAGVFGAAILADSALNSRADVLEAKADAPSAPQLGQEQSDGSVWDHDRAAYDPVGGEDIFYAARRSDMTGRLLRAFPTACVLLVDGGRFVGSYHLVDTFYGLHSMMEISVEQSRLSPVDTCVVSFSDTYNNLSAQSAQVELSKANDTRLSIQLGDLASAQKIGYDIQSLVQGVDSAFLPTAELLQRRNQQLKALLVAPGARLHVRLGYGSDASKFPTAFNGVIAGVQHQNDVLTVTADGDGVELLSQMSPAAADGAFYQKIGVGGKALEPRNIILEIMAAGYQNVVSQVTSNALSSLLSTTNPYGIESFGDLQYSGFFRGPLGRWCFSPTPFALSTTEVGINVYSGWTEQPVNITVASEDGALGALAAPIDLQNQVVVQLNKAVQDHLHPRGKEYLSGMGMNEMFRVLQGESLVGIRLENATPWGVIDELRKACVDYVAEVVPFGLRSTLFFGKDWWPHHYAYNSAFFSQTAEQQESQRQGLAQGMADPNAEPFFRRRPLLQAHYCHSGVNLIASSVEATQEGWATCVQAIGSYAGTASTDKTETSYVQFLDTDIFPSQQRMKLVQSGLYSTNAARIGEEAAHLDAGAAISFATGGIAGLSTNVLNNYAVGVLHDEVREMYRGDVTQQGNAWMRPRDLVHFVDAMRQISGPVEVKTVVHSFSPRSGFVTTWSPDCVAYAQDTQKMALLLHAVSAMSRYYATVKAYGIIRNGGGFRLRSGLSKTLTFLGAVESSVGRKAGALGNYGLYQVKRIGRNFFDVTGRGGRISSGKNKLVDYTRSLVNVQSGKRGVTKSDVMLAFENELGFGVGSFRHGGRGKGLTGVGEFGGLRDVTVGGQSVKVGGKTLTIPEKTFKAGFRKYTQTQLNDAVKRDVLRKTQIRVLKRQRQLVGPLDSSEEDRIKGFVQQIVEEASKGKADGDGFLSWFGRYLAPGSDGFYRAALEGLRKNEAVRNAVTRLENPEINKAAVKVFRDSLGKGNAALSSAITESLGQDDKIGAIEYAARFEARLNLLRARRDAISAKNPKPVEGTREFESLRIANAQVRTQEQALAALKEVTGGTEKTAGVFRAAGKAALSDASVAVAGAVGRGALRISELLVMAVVGPAITTINRQLASRQALKIIPLRNCGREWTAGINGHLGACVGDPLGSADAVIEFILGTGSGSAFGRTGVGRLAAEFGFNALDAVSGLEDPHYGSDSGTYKQLVDQYGLGASRDETPAERASANHVHLQRMADINVVGYNPEAVVSAASLGASPSLTADPGGFESRTGTMASAYAKMVRDMSTLIPVAGAAAQRSAAASSPYPELHQRDGDLGYKRCAVRIKRVLSDVGITAFPAGLPKAEDFIPALGGASSPYKKSWDDVTGAGDVASVPNGALVVWTSKALGNGAGHVAVVVHAGGRTYMLGNTDGDLAQDITDSQHFAHYQGAYLPRSTGGTAVPLFRPVSDSLGL